MMRERICPICRHGFSERHCPRCPRPNKEYDEYRGSSTSRGYNARWERVRKTWLKRNPECAYCPGDYKSLAVLIDHFVPHRGNQQIFWNKEFWRGSCQSCHSVKSAWELKNLPAGKSFEEAKAIMEKGLRTSFGRTSNFS